MCLLSAAAPVRASGPSEGIQTTGEHAAEVDTALTEASQAFEAGDFQASIAAFERAYTLEPDPNFLYNIGRVYEEAADMEKAIDYYRRFVREPRVDLQLREQALQRIQVLKAILDETAAEGQPKPEATVPPPTVEDDSAAIEPRSTDVDPKRQRTDRALTISGGVLLGVGVAAIVPGGVMYGLSKRDERDADAAPDRDTRLALLDDAKTKARAADGLLIGGGVVAGVGLALLIVGLTRTAAAKRSAAASANAAPVVGPSFVGASAGWRF